MSISSKLYKNALLNCRKPIAEPPPQETREKRCIGASILPYAFCGDNMYLLLGKERCYKPKGKRTDHQWSDFGGKCNESESSVECAAREYLEETLGVVLFSSSDERVSLETIKDHLSNKDYALKVTFPVNETGYYVTYLCEIPFYPRIQCQFSRLYTSLMYLSSFNNKHPAFNLEMEPSYMEKSELRWFSVPVLTIGIDNKGKLPLSSYSQPSILRSHFLYRLKHILEMLPSCLQYRTNWRIDPRNKSSDFANFNNKYRQYSKSKNVSKLRYGPTL